MSTYLVNIDVRNAFMKQKQDNLRLLLNGGLIQKAALYAALAEVIILPLLLIRLLTVGGTILSLFMYTQILLMRYKLSSYTREAFSIVDARICNVVALPIMPIFIRNIYNTIRGYMWSFANRA